MKAGADEERASSDDQLRCFEIGMEALFEIDSLADRILRATELDVYALRTIGTRLRELTTVLQIAVDNRGESSMTWAALEARLTGIPLEEVSHG